MGEMPGDLVRRHLKIEHAHAPKMSGEEPAEQPDLGD